MQASIKKRLYEILEEGREGDPVGIWFNRALVVLIIVNVAVSVLETVPDIQFDFGERLGDIQLVSGVLFAVEYLLRLYISDLHPPLRRFGPIGGRLRYAVQPFAIIDLLAALPLLFIFILPVQAIAPLVILRLLRFLKLARYSPALRSLMSAIGTERRALLGSLVIICGVVLVAATLMYLVESDDQPDAFGSIPHAMWWAIATVTTVGYGDTVPVTALGQILAGIVMLMGYGLLALPVGIIASAFAREIHGRDFVVTWSMVSRVPLFEDLKAAEIADVARLLRAHKVVEGEVIVERGEVASSMFFIASGEVEVALPRETLVLGEGGFFGEMALLKDRRRAATVKAMANSQLMVLESDSLRRLMEHNPELAKRILMEAEERMVMGREGVGDMAEEELDQPEVLDEAEGEPEVAEVSEPELFKELDEEDEYGEVRSAKQTALAEDGAVSVEDWPKDKSD